MLTCKEFFERHKQDLRQRIIDYNTQGVWTEPSLTVIQVGDNPASNKYIAGKSKDCKDAGIVFRHIKLNESVDQCYLSELITKGHNQQGALIVQLPLPEHLKANLIAHAVAPDIDVDGFHPDSPFTPCTPKGILMYLDANKIDLSGKNAVIIGRSEIVGKPMAKLLLERNCTVTICHSKTKNLAEYTKNADLIVVAVGKRNVLTLDMIDSARKPIVIDVGINMDEYGKLHGDCDYKALKNHCELITPVPGGVGLLTRCALLDNVVECWGG